MGLKLGAVAAGFGAGYMAADKWNKGKKKAKGTLGEGDVSSTEKADTGLTEPAEWGYGDGGYANGGLVTSTRWHGKKPPK